MIWIPNIILFVLGLASTLMGFSIFALDKKGKTWDVISGAFGGLSIACIILSFTVRAIP